MFQSDRETVIFENVKKEYKFCHGKTSSRAFVLLQHNKKAAFSFISGRTDFMT